MLSVSGLGGGGWAFLTVGVRGFAGLLLEAVMVLLSTVEDCAHA